MGIIYKATNNINGKVYVGQTIFSLDNRRKEHIRLSKANFPRYLFHRALKKYGEENFSWDILEECDKCLLNNLEEFYIALFHLLCRL